MKRIVGSALFIICFLTTHVLARCECTHPKICEAFTRAESVFVGTLIKTEESKRSGSIVMATFAVEQRFKGQSVSSETVQFRAGSCGPDLNMGERYFVYKDASASLRICNRTKPVAESASDLDYAKRMSSTSNPTFTISGRIIGLSTNQSKGAKLIIANGSSKREIPIDDDGFFSATVDEDSKYRVTYSLPFEAHIVTEVLGEEFSSKGRLIDYSLGFEPNGCDYRSIRISIDTPHEDLKKP